MSFPAYDCQRDSGVDWLGTIPQHWDVVRCRRLFEIQKEIAGKLGYDVFSITQNGFRVKDIDSGDGQLSMDYSKYQLVHPGDFAMNPMDLITGGADIAFTIGVTSPDYRVFRLRDECPSEPRFLLRIFQHCYRNRIFWPFGRGSAQLGRWRFPRQQFNEFFFPIPPIEEQRAIASFLDVETSKIDALVSEQRRLIELLKEKRQAVISHAVTKGLNPNAPMKPSGIQWLGDVPEHWEVGPLKRFWNVTDCKHITAEFIEDGGIPLASIREVQSKWIRLEEAKRTTQKFYHLLIDGGREPQVGDLIFSRNATVGEVAQVGEHTPQFAMGQDVCLLRRLHEGSSADYWQYVIKSPRVAEQMSVLMVGATFKRINVDEIRNLSVSSPPFGEQNEIAAFLNAKVERFDSLIAEAERAIQILQERRTALISAAVTGKIDVRRKRNSHCQITNESM